MPAGRYSLGLLHAVLDSFDLVAPLRIIEVTSDTNTVSLATPSAQTAYQLGCVSRLSEVANQGDVLGYLKVRAACGGLARRAAQQVAALVDADSSSDGPRRSPQMLRPVVVRDSARSLSALELYGFDDRRRHGLGSFITQEFLAKYQFQTLTEALASVPRVHVEYGTSGQPAAYLQGNKEGYCVPNVFIDGAPFNMPRPGPALRPAVARSGNSSLVGSANFSGDLGRAFSDLSSMAPPSAIRGIEVYNSPGTIPAQFDLMSSTGCGSIVIWTR